MKNNKSLLLMFGLILLSPLLAACSSSKDASFPSGKFIKSGALSHGLIFNQDGTFSVFEGGTTLVTGTYSVDGDTYTEESNNAGCTDVPRSFNTRSMGRT